MSDDTNELDAFFAPVEAAPVPIKAKKAREAGAEKFMGRKGSSHVVQPPPGYAKIELIMEKLQNKLRDAERETHEGKRKVESTWPILRITHQKSRFVFESYKRGKIDDATYRYCIEAKLASASLIKKWTKQGYEKLCCLQCASNATTNFGTTCICRVPKSHLEEGKVVECQTCGCRGCSSKN
eukprot:GHVH01000244.1.p1 GENE.GHVH01000244.1~~GHVH01000244.1.p1  ORF type:complete len:182 (-),score=22.79 GHVH01000244.1:37-582(-)